MNTTTLRVSPSQCFDLSGRSIEVVVGAEDPVTFSVHENIICAASEFFERAMRGNWNESKSRSVRLKSEDPEVFQVYLHWVYQKSLPVRIDSPGLDGNAEYLQFAKCYVLGDLLQDGNFKDAALDAILEKASAKASDGRTWYPVGPVVRHIYDNTVDSSKARRLLVDLYTQYGHGEWLRKWAEPEDLPKQFLHDLATEVLDKRAKTMAPPGDACRYHQHTPNEGLCYRKLWAAEAPVGSSNV